MSRRRAADARLCCLVIATLAALIGLFNPRLPMQRQASDLLFVFDITGSMMVRDYPGPAPGVARLQRAKSAVKTVIADLPCGSRAGVAIFTERQPFLLLAPMETCENYAPLVGAIDQLDWRMAWEGDSFISLGLFGAIDLAAGFGADAVFLTDGHEAPPLRIDSTSPEYRGDVEEPAGVIVGVGDLVASPIPRFDADGREAGTWGADEVIQENRSGPPPASVQQREGYEARNAPWGAAAAVGEEHLSGLREPYLETLSTASGLGYVRLDRDRDLYRAIEHHARSRPVQTQIPLAPWLAATLLLALLAFFALSLWSQRDLRVLPGHRKRVAFSVVERNV